MQEIRVGDILWVNGLKLLYSPNSNKMHPIMVLFQDKQFYYVVVMTSKKENARAYTFDIVEMPANIQNGMDRDSLIKIDKIYNIPRGAFRNTSLMGQADLYTYKTVLNRALEHMKIRKEKKLEQLIQDKLDEII